MSGSAPSPAPPSAPSDPVTAAVTDAVTCADRVAANTAKALAGQYTSADAAADLAACTATAAAWAGRLAGAASWFPLSLLAPPRWVPQPSSRVPGEITVARAAPLTLHTLGYRAIGYGADYFIHADRITFEPATVDPSAGPDFIMVVDWHSLPKAARDITIVYEGEVVSVQQGTTVCGPIRFVKPAFAS